MNSIKKYTTLLTVYGSALFINPGFAQAPGGVSTNLTVWYKADAASSITGNPVSAWAPAGGTAATYNLTQSTASKRPSFVSGATLYTQFNYNPRIQFSTTALTTLRNASTSPDLLGTNGVAIILTDQVAPNNTAFGYYSNSNYRYQLKPNFRFQTGVFGSGYTFDYTASTEYSINSASMIAAYGCGSSMTSRKNSVTTNCTNCGSATFNPSVSAALTLGSTGTAEYCNNSIGEVILYSVKPTLAEMDRIESYLAIKYGLTRGGNTQTTATYNYIASDGTTLIWDKTANTGYNNDIAGIGRDDASGLQQKQSISVNNAEALTIALGSTAIPTENATNASLFSSNISFLTWGNNGLSNTFNPAAVMPSGLVERLNRVWKSQETGFSQPVSFGFETSQVTGLGAIGTLCLLFDDDGNFSDAIVAGACTAINPTGSRVEFPGISIPAGKPYFTLARVKLPTLAYNNGPLCEGTTLNLTADTLQGSTYTWTGPNTYSNSVQSPTVVSAIASDSGVYTVTVNSYGCSTVLNTTVVITPTVSPTVAISLTAGSNPLCNGNTAGFQASTTNGGTLPSYQWQINGVNTGTNSAAFNPSSINNGDVISVTLTSNAACLASPTAGAAITMTVSPLITPSVSVTASANNICAGTAVNFTTSQANGGSTPVYQWSVNGTTVGTNLSSYNSSSLNTGDVVSVLLTSNAACLTTPTANASVTMTVSPLITPSVSITASANNICAGTAVNFTTSQANGGSTPVYQWSVNGTTVGTNLSSYNSSSLNTGDVISVLLSSNAACLTTPTANASVTMTVSPLITPSVSITASANNICAGTTVNFTTSQANGGSVPVYQWSVNGTPVGTNLSSYNSSSFNTGDVVGVTLTSNAACLTAPTANASVTMTVSPLITPSVSVTASNNNICAGTTVNFATSQANGGSVPVYQWSVNGTPVGTNLSSYNSSSLNNGDVVSVTLTSNAFCLTTVTANASVTMTVSQLITPSVSITASANNICAGSAVTFAASAINSGANPIYQWSVNGTPVGTNLSSYNSSSLNNGDVIQVVLTSNAVCLSAPTASTNITMVIYPIVTPTLIMSANKTTICTGTSVTFSVSETNGGVNPGYQWFVNGTAVGANSPTYHSATLNDGDVVDVTMTSVAGCVTTAIANSNSVTINVLPVPTASFTYAVSDQDVQFHDLSTNATSWAWDFGSLSSSTLQNPSYAFPGGAEYLVTLTASNGICKAVTNQTISIEGATYYIPNTFTPNGDGTNDFYYLVGTGISSENFEMSIFNRWGESVFKTNDINKAWDGKNAGGEDVAQGVYTYLFEFKLNNTSNVIKKAGNVTLFR